MIQDHYFLTVVFLLAAGTLIIRGSFISLSGKFVISQNLKDLFTFIPAAILPALIIPATFFHQGKVEWLENHERFVVILFTFVFAQFVKGTLATVCFGLVLLLSLTIFG